MKKHRLMFLVLTTATIATFAMAQKVVQPSSPPQQLEAADLDKLTAVPSLEQGILRAAADQLRQEKKPMASVELQMTVKVSAIQSGSVWCKQSCMYSGGHLWACAMTCPRTQ